MVVPGEAKDNKSRFRSIQSGSSFGASHERTGNDHPSVAGGSAPDVSVYRPVHLAVAGEGFFVLQEDGGTLLFSRSGCFHLDRAGFLVNTTGHRMQPPLSVSADAVRLRFLPDGMVLELDEDGVALSVSQLVLARFRHPDALQGLGLGLLAETLTSGPPEFGAPSQPGFGIILSGASEATLSDTGTDLALARPQSLLRRPAIWEWPGAPAPA